MNALNDREQSFDTLLMGIVNERLQIFMGESLSTEVCYKIYQVIFYALEEIMDTVKKKAGNVPLGNEALNFIAQWYYDCLSINANCESGLDPNIFTQRASLTNISTKELAFIVMLMKGCEIVPEIMREIKRRS